MKKILTLLAIALVGLTSCTPEEEEIVPPEPEQEAYLNVYYDDIVFPSDGGEDSFEIDSNTDWVIASDADWLTVEPAEGNGYGYVTLTASASDLYDDRNTVITVKAGDKTETFTVTQKCAEALLVTKNKFDIPQEGGDFTIEIQSNISYEIQIDSDSQSWISEAPQSKALTTYTHTFSVESNPNTTKRDGSIEIIGSNGKTETVNIYQAQKDELVLSKSEETVPAKGGEVRVQLRSNVDYEVIMPENTDWIEQIQSDKADELVFNVKPNDSTENREAEITIKDKNSKLSQTFTIIQISKTTVNEDITLKTNEDVIALRDAGYEIINGNLTISGSSLKTLGQLENIIREINGDLIIDAPTLESLDGLYGLVCLNGNLIVKSTSISSFEGLNNLKEIKGYFSLGAEGINKNRLTNLKSFQGLDNLETIDGTLTIRIYYSLQNNKGNFSCNQSLTSLSGLNSLKTIGGLIIDGSNYRTEDVYWYVRDWHCPFTSLEGLSALETINGDFKLSASYYNLIDLKSFEGLNNLKEIKGNFSVSIDMEYRTDYFLLNGLDNLRTIGGTFNIGEGFDSLSGLKNLENIGESFIVTSKITTFQGFNNLVNIGGAFELPTSLKILDGLNCLKTIGGDFIITPDNLSTCTGLNNLRTVGGNMSLTLYDSMSLESLFAVNGNLNINIRPHPPIGISLPSLSNVGGSLRISGIVPSLNGLGNSLSIAGTLEISLPQLISFDGIKVKNVQNIMISQCPSLIDISALGNSIECNVNDVTFSQCESLYDFSPFITIAENMTGTWFVTGCGYNPTKYQMLNGESKPQE